VWVLGLEDETSGKPLPLEPTRRSGSWEVKDGGQMSLGRPEATLRWEGRFEGDAVLKLVRHPWSGLARVTLNGETVYVVALLSPALLFVRRGALAREEVPAPSVRGEAAPVGGQSSPEVASA
ncbi:hypothetical protein, partial [Archangium sp.]|uniref:hypothetical protein n=1 Tax=Archangium sp. TaxID=1872627 RepID=UPI00389AE9D3